MNKLKQIEVLVEESHEKLRMVGGINPDQRPYCMEILTDLAKRSAKIDRGDFQDSWGVEEYNSRLRGEVKCTCKNPLEYANCDKKCVRYYEEVGQEQPALQPLPDNAPEWLQESLTEVYNNRMDMRLFYSILKRHFGTQPREWWMDLKKGDKITDDTGNIRTFTGTVFLETGASVICDVTKCSPYTDPTQSFRDKLSPELQHEFDKLTIK